MTAVTVCVPRSDATITLDVRPTFAVVRVAHMALTERACRALTDAFVLALGYGRRWTYLVGAFALRVEAPASVTCEPREIAEVATACATKIDETLRDAGFTTRVTTTPGDR